MPEATNVITSLTQSNNPIVALLACMVIVLAGVVVFQWRYATINTVPKWLWDSMIEKIESIQESQKTVSLILDERLKK